MNQITKSFAKGPVFISYYNPILSASIDDFYVQAKESGVDGILIVDLPFEHASEHESYCINRANRIGIIK